MVVDASEDPISFEYSPGDPDEPSMTILEAVASTKGVCRTEIEPLNDVIDADALSNLFSGDRREFYRRTAPPPPAAVTLTFRYGGCDVTVQSGRVRVRDV